MLELVPGSARTTSCSYGAAEKRRRDFDNQHSRPGNARTHLAESRRPLRDRRKSYRLIQLRVCVCVCVCVDVWVYVSDLETLSPMEQRINDVSMSITSMTDGEYPHLPRGSGGSSSGHVEYLHMKTAASLLSLLLLMWLCVCVCVLELLPRYYSLYSTPALLYTPCYRKRTPRGSALLQTPCYRRLITDAFFTTRRKRDIVFFCCE